MSQLARLLGTFAPGHVLEHAGVEFTFARVSQAMKVTLESAYFRRAREAVYALKGELQEAEYVRALEHVTDRYTRGEMGFPLGEALHYYTTAGLPHLVAVMTGRPAAECEDLVEERQEEVFSIVWCVLAESSRALKKRMLAAESAPQTQAAMALLATLLAGPSGNGTRRPASPSAG